MVLKTAVFAPTPSAKIRTTMAANPGVFAMSRKAYLRSCMFVFDESAANPLCVNVREGLTLLRDTCSASHRSRTIVSETPFHRKTGACPPGCDVSDIVSRLPELISTQSANPFFRKYTPFHVLGRSSTVSVSI